MSSNVHKKLSGDEWPSGIPKPAVYDIFHSRYSIALVPAHRKARFRHNRFCVGADYSFASVFTYIDSDKV